MSKWWLIGWAVILVLSAIASGWLYFSVGLKPYLKAQRVIREIVGSEARDKAFQDFYWYEPERVYGGILAGDFFGRVWVWGIKGLRSFAVDERSVYSWFDGCC